MPLNNGPVQEFDFEAWLRDGLKGLCRKVEPRTTKRLDVSAFRTHMRNARKEQLLAIRSLIDSGMELLEKKEKQAL